MLRKPFHHDSERGSITIFFVLFALVMIGVVAYSLYVGRAVDEKIKVDVAADASSLAMASHAAQGLNMIATNNLAVAANLHVMASTTFIGRYYAVARAFLSDIFDLIDIIKMFIPGLQDDVDYAKGFAWTAPLNGHFSKTAAGLTSINKKLGTLWLYAAPIKGVEQARLNAPGSIAIPLQIGRLAAGSPEALYAFKYEELGLADAEQTMCQTVSSSHVVSKLKRDAITFWLGGLVDSVAGGSTVMEVIRLFEVPLIALKAGPDAVIKINDDFRENCSWIWNPFACLGKIATNPLADVMRMIPFPRWDKCGMPDDDSGNFGKQLKAYAADNAGEDGAIGFVFPQVDGGNVQKFEDSLQYAVIVGRPLYIDEELPRQTVDGVEMSKCPAEWKQEVNGREVCSLVLDGIDFGTRTDDKEVSTMDTASGGVAQAVGRNDGQAGALRNAWKRVQWSISQAKAEYEPDIKGCPTPDNPGGAQRPITDCDPVGSTHAAVAPGNPDQLAAKRRMQLLWPAWRSRNATPTMMEAALKMLGQ